jgi:toxin ParE1/3/4
MANYVLTNKAVDDLSGIWNYTYNVWSEKQADKYYKMLLESCQELADKPGLGKNYDEINKDIYGFKAGNHLIFYRKHKDDSIEIIRILHIKMDLKSRIQE